ncbi:MAG: ribosome-binding factor A, partial [Bdellovibrionales bacterium RIFOXYD1_FULL_44_7]
QEKLSVIISREVKDPRIPQITVTSVELTQDASQATVYVAIFGGAARENGRELSEKEAKQRMKDCIAGLSSASGFMRRHLARAIEIRQIPSLIFKEDRGIENVSRVHELLKEISSDTKKP